MYARILVPVDGSDTAGRGLREAIALGRALGARLRLIHVINFKTPAIIFGEAGYPSDEPRKWLRREGERIMHAAEIAAVEALAPFESALIETVEESTGAVIVQQAQAWPADLVVMGTHGRRGLGRLLMGSDAEFVLRHTVAPVLLVREPAGN